MRKGWVGIVEELNLQCQMCPTEETQWRKANQFQVVEGAERKGTGLYRFRVSVTKVFRKCSIP